MPDEVDGSGRLIDAPHPGPIAAAAQAYRMRWKRRRLLWRSFRSRHALCAVTPHPVQPLGAILAVACVRNEALRLPYWLAHNRRLGVDRFLVVDNGSDDGTRDLLADQPDVSLWSTDAGYKASRFGMDWLNHLLNRFGAGHWCLTVDADELLVYPHSARLGLAALAAELDRRRQPALGTLMVELYPKGPLAGASYLPGQDPTEALPFFDAEGYRIHRQRPARNLWVQGGPRERVFFADRPALSPT
ncbi:MAG: glycosyltransferase family 2 protein, partial [Pseudomonadota bacterium]